VTYEIPPGLVPSDANYEEAVSITTTFLEDYLRATFQYESTILDSLDLTASGFGNSPASIDFSGCASFAEESEFIPTGEQLDILIATALQQPTVETLLLVLQSLDPGNPFAQTNSVEYSTTTVNAPELLAPTPITASDLWALIAAWALVGLMAFVVVGQNRKSFIGVKRDPVEVIFMNEAQIYDTTSLGHSDSTSIMDTPSIMTGYGNGVDTGDDDVDDNIMEIKFQPATDVSRKWASRSDPLFQAPFSVSNMEAER